MFKKLLKVTETGTDTRRKKGRRARGTCDGETSGKAREWSGRSGRRQKETVGSRGLNHDKSVFKVFDGNKAA